jgi:DNA-binding response OmpR family regulator
VTSARILVVEDEPAIRALMVEILSDAGFEVDEAGNSDVAVRLLDADGYKLLVTDVNMPGELDGAQLAERAHNKDPELPVVFITARPEVLVRLRNAGIPSEILPKPFTLERLVSVVRELIKTGSADVPMIGDQKAFQTVC